MSWNTSQASFEGDLKVLKRSKLCRSKEYGCLLQAVERFQQELRLSSLQCKDRNQLSQQWEDQQFYRILVRMLHEVTITTGMKQKEDLKKVYHWYQTNKSVLHSQPHFKGAAAKDVYKRPVLKFAPDALKYYSTPHDKRRQKRVAFDGDGKARSRHQSSRPRRSGGGEGGKPVAGSPEEAGGKGGQQRPVTAPPGLHRPKVSNSLPKSPDSPQSGSTSQEASFAAGYVNDHVGPAPPDIQTLQRPSSALALIRQANAYEMDSISGELRTDVSPDDYLASASSLHSGSSVIVHVPPSEAGQDPGPGPGPGEGKQQQGLESQSDVSMATREIEAATAAMLKHRHPISSLVNPVARFDQEEEEEEGEVYEGGPSPDQRGRSPVRLQMHVDVPAVTSSDSQPPLTSDESRAESLERWGALQGQRDPAQEVAAMQAFYGHGGLPANVRYASHEGGEMPELYTQEVLSSYAQADTSESPMSVYPPGHAITTPSLEDFYELTERHSPHPRPSSRGSKYPEVRPTAGEVSEEATSQSRNSMVHGSGKEKSVKFESVVDLADQVGDQLSMQKEKLTPEPRYGYRQPVLRISPAHSRPQSAKQAASPSPPSPSPPSPSPSQPSDRQAPSAASPSSHSLAESSKVLFAPPNSSRQSTCSSSEFSPRNKKGDPIVLLPETSQYTVHFRRNRQPDTPAYVPHAISRQGRVVPDQQRYSRVSSAPGKRSLRSAGSTSAGYRPRTARTESAAYHSGSAGGRSKASEPTSRVPQAASHNTACIGPQSLASMMVVNHLGNEQRRGRMRMGGPNYYLDEDFELPPPAMEYMSFTGPAKLMARGAVDKAVSIPTDETRLSDVTPPNPPSQPSPLESLPSQEWGYRQSGSSRSPTEGLAAGPAAVFSSSSQGYADSLEAGSESTAGRSLSQDLDDLDDDLDGDDLDDGDDHVLNGSRDSQDLGSDVPSAQGASSEQRGEETSSPALLQDCGDVTTDADGRDADAQDAESTSQEAHAEAGERRSDCDSTVGGLAEIAGADSVESERDERPSEDVADGPSNEDVADGPSSDAELQAYDEAIGQERPGAREPDPSVGMPERESICGDFSSGRESDVDVSSERSSTEQPTARDAPASDGAHISPAEGHRGRPSDWKARQGTAPEQMLDRNFLAVTRGNAGRRPRSASPRLSEPEPGAEGRSHCEWAGRPSSARVEASVPSVFTIEIDSARERHSTRSLQTVPIAYMSLSEDHRSQLQQRALPLVDWPGPHPRGRQQGISPGVSRKPLTPRSSAKSGQSASTRVRDGSLSPAPSVEVSPAGTRDNSLYSPVSSRSNSPVAMVLRTHLDNLEEAGRLESMVPHLAMQMRNRSPGEEEEGPPEPPASIDDGWSDVDFPDEAMSNSGHYLSPPRIQVQRPNSAPLSRTDSSSQSAPTSRPSSARVDGGRRRSAASPLRDPGLGVAAGDARPTSASGTGQRKEWKGRPLPVYGPSRDVEADARAVQLAREAKTSVNIRELFSGAAAKEFRKDLERQERERWEKLNKDSKYLNRSFRDYLLRQEIALVQRPDMFNRDWARGYLSDKMLKDRMRQEKWSKQMRLQALENKKALEQLKRIGPSVDIWELFHGGKRGVTKAQMKKAAVTIQKYIRGWIVRSMLAKVKDKSRVHAGSFKSFVKYYAKLMKRIARWHGVKKPPIHLDLWQMDEFMDRKRYYEYVFAKRSQPSASITIRELDGFFKECDHYPSKREIFNAISGATKKDGRKLDAKLSEREVVEVAFMIYVPRGSSLNPKDIRRSTWLNPLVDGKEARKLMGSDEVEKAEYAKSLQVVFAAFQERQEKEQAAKEREKKKLEGAAKPEADSKT